MSPSWALLLATLLMTACGTPYPSTNTGGSDGGSLAHGPGILNPADPTQFHGVILANTGYNFDSCRICHGPDLSGLNDGPNDNAPSCLTCHPQGPTTCDTCHGATGMQKLVGAHPAHLQDSDKVLMCSECHVQPSDYRDPGHLYNADGSPIVVNGVQPPVPVVFAATALASVTPPGAVRAGPPTYDRDSDHGCDNIYCHGAVFAAADAQARSTRPLWAAPDPSLMICGTCHGLPPQNHLAAQTDCYRCHGGTVDVNRVLIPGGLHMNGKIDLGNGSGTCGACHGDPQSAATCTSALACAAPPNDVQGRSDATLLSVGAHQAHMAATHRLRGPIACTECHRVPAQVSSPGHIDVPLPAAVFPAGVTGTLAQTDGAVPAWDASSGTCSATYCHGNGATLRAGNSAAKLPNLIRAPVWNQADQAGCGACHGIPPTSASHAPNLRLTDCATCHPSTIDTSGTIIVTTNAAGQQTSTHINGALDVAP